LVLRQIYIFENYTKDGSFDTQHDSILGEKFVDPVAAVDYDKCAKY
jgi:hypothetical protein